MNKQNFEVVLVLMTLFTDLEKLLKRSNEFEPLMAFVDNEKIFDSASLLAVIEVLRKFNIY